MLADVCAAGGTPSLVNALMATRLGQRVEKEEARRVFWLSVYKFFIDNPLLDQRHVGPIVDFLNAQKFEVREVVTGPGQVERQLPPQPNLSMSRRTPDSLLRQVAAWHGELRTIRSNENRFWRASKWKGASLHTGSKDNRTLWEIRELLSLDALVLEGKKLRHCIASYADSCTRGAFSVWSMTQQRRGADTAEKVLTIAVDARGTVTEARGFANRYPTDSEMALLRLWMNEAGLSAGRYLEGW